MAFYTEQQLQQPTELATAITNLSTSSIFYHCVDAHCRTSNRFDDFSDWLAAFGDEFVSLRDQLARLVTPYFQEAAQ